MPGAVWPTPRVPWAELRQRVFGDDLLTCSCGGRRVVLAVVTGPESVRELMEVLGATDRTPVDAPRGPPELFDDPSPAFAPDPPSPEE